MAAPAAPITYTVLQSLAHSVIFEAIGAASMCWETPEGAGVFLSDQALAIGKNLVRQLQDLGYEL